MLLAEIHGHVLEAAAGDEDYLTSAVFGHLRYVPPTVFWEDFLAATKGFPVQTCLSEELSKQGLRISQYSSLKIHFWPSHAEFGEPDLVLCFSGSGLRPLVVLTEVKLWSGKSGEGEHDQLVKYVKLLSDLRHLKTNETLPGSPLTALLYLTPRESIGEIQDTLSLLETKPTDFLGIFRVQWQELLAMAIRTMPSEEGMARTILQDVQRFLRRRGLEYFRGFNEELYLPALDSRDGAFYAVDLFVRRTDLDAFAIERAGWIQ
jgi:hypothetical protein